MCVILLCTTNSRPTLREMHECETCNPDGIGVAWREEGQVHWEKGIDVKRAWTLSNMHTGPFLLHFRLASSGGKSPLLCHPFPVGGSLDMTGTTRGMVVAHNGHMASPECLMSLTGIKLEGPASDTRVVAALMAQKGVRIMRDMPGLWVTFGAKGVSKSGAWDKMRSGLWASNLYWEGGGGYFSCGQAYQQYCQTKERTSTTTTKTTTTMEPILLPKPESELNFCDRCGERWHKCECPITSCRYDNRDLLAGMD